MNETLAILKEVGYRWGSCQALRYDPKKVDVFPEGYVTKLYKQCRGVGKHDNILPRLFCGMRHLDHDSITTYLLGRPLIIPVVWTSKNQFVEAGIAFPTVFMPGVGIDYPERSCMAGYGFFSQFWGNPDTEVLAMLGLAYIFVEFDLIAIHGVRYPNNELTARFMARFGFRETGRVPRYQPNAIGTRLTDGVVSSLFIEDFATYVEKRLEALLGSGQTVQSSRGESDGRKGWRDFA